LDNVIEDTLNYGISNRADIINYLRFHAPKLDRACRDKAFQSRINSLNARSYHL